MAKKKDNTVLILGVAALGIYLYFRSTQQTAALPTVLSPAPANNPNSVQSVIPQTVQAAAPVDPAIGSQAVINWAQGSLKPVDWATFQQQMNNFTQADWDGLYALITVPEWGTPVGTAFWNAWRVKYGIDVA